MKTHGAVTIVYDGDGNRVSETIGGTTTKFLVDDHNPTYLPQVMDELVNSSVTRTYAYGLNRISQNQLVNGTWTPSFYGYDAHGNVRFLANTAASVTDSYDYDAFGMPIKTSGATPNTFLYSGERYDSSVGLYDLRARYYNQATGRFWARDPVEGNACSCDSCSPLSLNPYLYTRQNPVNWIDPTGRAVALPRPAPGSEYIGVIVAVSFAAIQGLPQLTHAINLGFAYATEQVDCAEKLVECIETKWWPYNPQYGRPKDCLACYFECQHQGSWPEYKCPSH